MCGVHGAGGDLIMKFGLRGTVLGLLPVRPFSFFKKKLCFIIQEFEFLNGVAVIIFLRGFRFAFG